MDLNQYPSGELRTLQLAVAIAQNEARKLDQTGVFTELDTWGKRIEEAIKDAEFEEQYAKSTVS